MMMHELLTKIDLFLAETGMKPSRFGRRFMGDPSFVSGLRSGSRECLPSTSHKLIEKMEAAQKPARLLTTGGES